MFCLAAALAVVAAQPLIKAEYDLLMDLYAVTGCRSGPCPRFLANESCAGNRLTCVNSHVTGLDLGNVSTALSGTLPSSLNAFSFLTNLELQDNVLTGNLPEVDQLTRLTRAYLQVNRLSGSIPASFGALTAIIQLSFRDNPLISGPLPNFAALTALNLFRLDNTLVSGPLSLPNVTWDLCNFNSSCVDCAARPAACACSRRFNCPTPRPTPAPTASPTPAPTPTPRITSAPATMLPAATTTTTTSTAQPTLATTTAATTATTTATIETAASLPPTATLTSTTTASAATTTIVPSNASTSLLIVATAPEPASSLPLIIGASVGGAVLLALVAAIIIVLRKRARSDSATMERDTLPPPSMERVDSAVQYSSLPVPPTNNIYSYGHLHLSTPNSSAGAANLSAGTANLSSGSEYTTLPTAVSVD